MQVSNVPGSRAHVKVAAAVLATCLTVLAAAAVATDGDAVVKSVFITLGTNSGPIPNPERAEPANYLRYADEQMLVDAGDGVSDQLGKAGIPLGEITTVFISHLHFDHTGGLFGFLGQRYQTRNPGTVTIYGPAGTGQTVEGLLAAMQPMADAAGKLARIAQRGPADNINVVELRDGSTVQVGAVAVTAAVNSHYILTDKTGERGLSLSFRFDMPDRSIVYTSDTGPSAAVERLAQDVDLLVCEIMIPERSLAKLQQTRPDIPPPALAAVKAHYENQHMSPTQAGLLAARSRAKALLLTHIAIEPEDIEEARSGISAEYSGPVTFATDLGRY